MAAEFCQGRREVAGVLSSEPDSAVALPHSYRQPDPAEYRFVVRWTFKED